MPAFNATFGRQIAGITLQNKCRAVWMCRSTIEGPAGAILRKQSYGTPLNCLERQR